MVIALFSITALAAGYAVPGSAFTLLAAEWFIGFSMVVLAPLKLQNIESFATMFLNYDLLAKCWVPYSYIYPFDEGLAGVLMIAGALTWLSVPIAMFIGTIGAVSVFKAVYVDNRELKCDCVGGPSIVPLGFISLAENLMMICNGGVDGSCCSWPRHCRYPYHDVSHPCRWSLLSGREEVRFELDAANCGTSDFSQKATSWRASYLHLEARRVLADSGRSAFGPELVVSRRAVPRSRGPV